MESAKKRLIQNKTVYSVTLLICLAMYAGALGLIIFQVFSNELGKRAVFGEYEINTTAVYAVSALIFAALAITCNIFRRMLKRYEFYLVYISNDQSDTLSGLANAAGETVQDTVSVLKGLRKKGFLPAFRIGEGKNSDKIIYNGDKPSFPMPSPKYYDDLVSTQNKFAKAREARRVGAAADTPESTLEDPRKFKLYYNNKKFLFLSFFIPFTLMLLGFVFEGIYPFDILKNGRSQILVVDFWHQYYPFIQNLHYKLQNGGSLLYSWQEAFGTNFISLMSYYFASPLNFLAVIVPQEYLREAVAVMVMIRVGCAGLFASLYLRYAFKKNDLTITLFSVPFALCAYIMGYYWNIMWLDTVALAPLVALGVTALLRERKFKIFVISLALSVMTNYYIGLFNCVLVVFCFIGITINDWDKYDIKGHLRRLARISLFSIISIAITAIITLPAYLGLKLTNSTIDTFSYGTNTTMDILNIFSSVLGYQPPDPKNGHIVNLYCGVIALFFSCAFFALRKIKLREKIFCLCLLTFLILSIYLRPLDYIWHGFHYTNMLPFRFSYIFSMVMLYMGFKAFTVIDKSNKFDTILMTLFSSAYIILAIMIPLSAEDETKVNDLYATLSTGIIVAAIICMLAIAAIAVNKFTYKNKNVNFVGGLILVVTIVLALFFSAVEMNELRESVLKVDNGLKSVYIRIFAIVCTSGVITVFAALMLLFNKRVISKKQLASLLFVIVMAESVFYSILGVHVVGSSGRDSYYDRNTEVQEILTEMRAREKDSKQFYRSEMTTTWTLNDAMLYNYDGINQFSSLTKVNVTHILERMGLAASNRSNRFIYFENTPVATAFLNLKYLMAKAAPINDLKHYSLVYEGTTGARLYQNNYYLPLGFMTDSNIKTLDITNIKNHFDFQNDLFKKATGIQTPAFDILPVESENHQNITCSAYNYDSVIAERGPEGNYSIILTDSSQAGTVNFVYKMPKDGSLYIYGDAGQDKPDSLTITNQTSGATITRSIGYDHLFAAGEHKKGDLINVSGTFTTGGQLYMYPAVINEDVLQEGFTKLASSPLIIDERADTYLKAHVNAKQDGMLYTSISYEKGWTVHVDGKKVEPYAVGKAFLGLELTAGDHEITMSYSPDGFIPGAVISFVGIVVLVALSILAKKKIIFRGSDGQKQSETDASA